MISKISQREIDSISDITFELDKNIYQVEKSIDPKNPKHYINNRELYEELCRYHKTKLDALERGEEIPPLTEKIGKAIIQIATRRCNSWNFVGYSDSWKQEMISNAILVATIRGHNFDPAKTNNPFAYFTQICNNAIVEQLKREKHQLYFKYKLMDMSGGFQASVSSLESNDEFSDSDMSDFDPDSDIVASPNQDATYEDRMKFIMDYEERIASKKKKKDVDEDIITLE